MNDSKSQPDHIIDIQITSAVAVLRNERLHSLSMYRALVRHLGLRIHGAMGTAQFRNTVAPTRCADRDRTPGKRVAAVMSSHTHPRVAVCVTICGVYVTIRACVCDDS